MAAGDVETRDMPLPLRGFKGVSPTREGVEIISEHQSYTSDAWCFILRCMLFWVGAMITTW